MKVLSKPLVTVLSVLLGLALGIEFIVAQENIQTPSRNTKQAPEKFSKTPASIGRSVEVTPGAANTRLSEVIGDKPPIKTKVDLDDTSTVLRKTSEPEPSKYARRLSRDPFRPPSSIQTPTSKGSREHLSPLERLELGQLKVVGIIWDVKEPRAMIEDTAGLGYTVFIGTPIGASDGKVKAISRNQVVVEEFFQNFAGKKKARDVVMRLSTE
jgi:Tfp pilus assembly protein PilP